MIFKESRKELLNLLQNPPSTYLDVCPFCQKRLNDHSKREVIICVLKKEIAQGVIPEHYELPEDILDQMVRTMERS